jgi:O-antigen/teichoic acid export membrane protein
MFREILNTIWTKIFSAILALGILIITTQYLGADGRGLVSLIYSSIGIIGIFAGFVGGPAVIYLAAKEKMQYLLLPIYSWILFVAIIGSALAWILQIVPVFYIPFIAVLAITSSIYVVNLYIIVGHQKVRTNNVIYMLQWAINLATLVLFFSVLNQANVEFVAIALLISNIFGLAFTFHEMRKISGTVQFDWSEEVKVIKSLVSLSFFAQAAAVMYYLYNRLGIFLLNIFAALFAVGIYSVGVNISDFIILASQSIALVEYSRISNSTDREYARNITIRLSKFGFLITLGITLLLLLLPDWVFTLVFGRDFASVHGVLLTMAPGIVVFGAGIIIFNYFAGIGRNRVNAGAAVVGLIVNVLFCYLLIPLYGSMGAGIASSISFIVMSSVLIIVFLDETNTRFKELFIRSSDFTYLFRKFQKDIVLQKENGNKE